MTLAAALTAFGPVIVALFTMAGVAFTIYSNRCKVKADAASALTTASTVAIDNLTNEITRLTLRGAAQLLTIQDDKLAAKRALELVARLLQGVNILLGQLRVANLCPDWLPDPEIERLVALCTEESDRLAIPKIVVNAASVVKG